MKCCNICPYESSCAIDPKSCNKEFAIFDLEKLPEHEAKIRVGAIREFAEWFKKSNYYLCYNDTIDDVVAEYEKENKI